MISPVSKDMGQVEHTPTPCPFCCATNIQFETDGDGNGWHTCPSCGAQGPLENKRQSEDDPNWDRRPAHDDLVKALEDFVRFLRGANTLSTRGAEIEISRLCGNAEATLSRIKTAG